MENWNLKSKEMPRFDGDYLCWINEPQECGAIHEYYKVVTCQNNIWLVGVLQFVKAWKELPSNPFDENNRMKLKKINSGIVQEKTPIQKAISLIEDAFENNEKNAFLREQAKRIRWKLENLLLEEKEHFINFYNQGGSDMLQDETFGLQRFLEKYEDYVLNEDERSN